MTTQPTLITQPTRAPTRKVAAGGIGTSAGIILGWAALSLASKLGFDIPPEIQGEIYALASGLGGLLTGVVSAYLTRERGT